MFKLTRSTSLRLVFTAAIISMLAPQAFGQFHDPDPAAAAAFEKMVKAYRDRPALTVRETVTVEVAEADFVGSSDEVVGEFTFGNDHDTIAKVRQFTVYLSGGNVTITHDENAEAYFTTGDDGSPYYALMAIFMDLPFPHLALALGEQDMNDLYMQFHPGAPWARPTSVRTERRGEHELQIIRMTSDFEVVEIHVDPATQLMQAVSVEISGGGLVREGTTMTYEHTFTYETHDEPLPKERFVFDPQQRERVDQLVSLMPRREQGERAGVAAGSLVGKTAPPLVLATIDGGAIDLEELRGQVVVIDFWATWCGPCIQALPLLHEVDRWARDEMLPVTVLTVNTFEIPNRADNSPDARLKQASEFWAKHNFRLPVAMDFTDEVAASYAVRGIPTTIIVRSDGVVHAEHVGAGGDYVQTLKKDIQEAIAALEW